MKLNERYVDTWKGYADEAYHIYEVILPGGKSVAFILAGVEKKFVAAFEDVDDAIDAICGWPKLDQEGNQWRLEAPRNAY